MLFEWLAQPFTGNLEVRGIQVTANVVPTIGFGNHCGGAGAEKRI
jgi:hypothetical protein